MTDDTNVDAVVADEVPEVTPVAEILETPGVEFSETAPVVEEVVVEEVTPEAPAAE